MSSVKKAIRIAARFQSILVQRPTIDFYDLPKLTIEEIARLEEPFTVEEIQEVVFGSDGNKSPGPDGFNLDFLMHCWVVVGCDVVKCIQEFHHFVSLPKVILSYFITLIPKTNIPKGLDKYRPISLIWCVYKVVSKILVARLGYCIERLISNT